MSLEFVINGEASVGAWEKPGPLQLHAHTPPTGATSRRRPPRGAFLIPRPLAVVDYYLSDAEADVPLYELARVAKAAHRIEERFERAEGEAGLADYQVRNWPGWHRYMTLSLLAAWFLTEGTRRGKIGTPAMTSPQLRRLIAGLIGERLDINELGKRCRRAPAGSPQRTGEALLPSFT